MINQEIKILTSDPSINLNNLELNSSKYETIKKNEETVYAKGKRTYIECRGGYWRAPKSRAVRALEAKLREQDVVFCEWMNENLLMMVFSTGTIAYLSVDLNSLDLTKVLIDRYCSGKLLGQTVSGFAACSRHLIFTHAESAATLVTLGPNKNSTIPTRIADRNPFVQNVELADSGRRGLRRVSCSEHVTSSRSDVARVLICTSAAADPAPWTPAMHVRANLHLYQIHGHQMNVVAYHQLENETLLAELSKINYTIIHIVEQTISHKNGVSLDWVRYDIPISEEGVVRLSKYRSAETRVILPANARAVDRSACDLRMLVACIDGTLHVIHHSAGLTHSTRAGFIASQVRWSHDICVCMERRVHCYDRALQTLRPRPTTDIAAVRDDPHTKILATWTLKIGVFLLILYSGGPLALVRITHPQLPIGWIRAGRLSRAVAWLRACDWDAEGDLCLHALQTIAKECSRKALTAATESAFQAALGTFMGNESAPQRYRPAIDALARAFHRILLRYGRVDKALRLGVDVASWDLFADVRWVAARRRLPGKRDAAALQRDLVERQYARSGSESECSESCSCSSHSSSSKSDEDTPPPIRETKPPPLPRVSLPTLLPVPINRTEPPTTSSIRPNLHQYLERDHTIWNTEVREDKRPIRWHSLDDVLNEPQNLPRQRSLLTIEKMQCWQEPAKLDMLPVNDIPQYNSVYQRKLPETPLYRYQNVNSNDRLTKTEKNVKFSDTVTVAVMPQSSSLPQVSRELADSLPLSPPHAYLAAFDRPAAAAAAGTVHYVEV